MFAKNEGHVKPGGTCPPHPCLPVRAQPCRHAFSYTSHELKADLAGAIGIRFFPDNPAGGGHRGQLVLNTKNGPHPVRLRGKHKPAVSVDRLSHRAQGRPWLSGKGDGNSGKYAKASTTLHAVTCNTRTCPSLHGTARDLHRSFTRNGCQSRHRECHRQPSDLRLHATRDHYGRGPAHGRPTV